MVEFLVSTHQFPPKDMILNAIVQTAQ